MKITFKLVDEQHVDIMCGENKIGHIFSPSGSGENVLNAIQVCGFDEAFSLWGCGCFAEKKKKDSKAGEYSCSSIMKKDIQLRFSDYVNDKDSNNHYYRNCTRCYNSPCTCEVLGQNGIPFIVKHEYEIKDKLEYKNGEIAAQNEVEQFSMGNINNSQKIDGSNLCPKCKSKNIRYFQQPDEWMKNQPYNSICENCKHRFNRV